MNDEVCPRCGVPWDVLKHKRHMEYEEFLYTVMYEPLRPKEVKV